MKGLLDPKMDFVFKNIFGSEKNPKILISFLNATLKPKDLITSVEIKNTDINKNYLEDKFSRLDVKATTSNDEIINIEIQLKNEYNMIKRSLYYWSKLYSEQLNEGEDYSLLKRTICINILNFKYLKTRMFQSDYRKKEIHTNEELTDIEENHFIENEKGTQICFPEGCSDPFEDEEALTGVYRSSWIIDTDIPIFKGKGREYIDRLVFVGEE